MASQCLALCDFTSPSLAPGEEGSGEMPPCALLLLCTCPSPFVVCLRAVLGFDHQPTVQACSMLRAVEPAGVARRLQSRRICLARPPRTKLNVKIKRGTSTQNKQRTLPKRRYFTKDGQKPPQDL